MKRTIEVKMWEQTVNIPTYNVGEKNKNPMFLEKRVYQGSSGRVYPYPVIDKIYDEKVDKEYKMLFLENEYIQIQIMPEIGGRIYRALDKTNNYDFVYYNRVIKPALVGLAGPWISGGIEFNWPQHHRPNTFGEVEYTMIENDDGSKTIWVGETDLMYGLHVSTGFTVYPDKSFIEIKSKVYNRTELPQTFLWWANPAVEVHDETQSIFPPDVHAVFDHGKRDVSKFPIATGTYYKQDYSAGVDISKYKNIPVPTSYMAYHSDYNFMGGYDYRKKAGILHIADHHVSPGKKQWTWGCGDFGKAWDRNLTDEDGPYIELMTGVYTDNQPDFTWIEPGEEKTFTQYFMPYKEAGQVKNANTDVVIDLEFDKGIADIVVYGTHEIDNARVRLLSKGECIYEEIVSLSPTKVFNASVKADCNLHELSLEIFSHEGKKMLDYTPAEPTIEIIPEAAKAIGKPEELKNTEALYLAGQHLEQYRHATYEPEPYYLEGLKRDPDDIRINNAYGRLLLRRGEYEKAEAFFHKAVNTSIKHSPNPYDGEPYYNLGLALRHQGKLDKAYDAFFKSTWSYAWQASGYMEIAKIDVIRGDYHIALEHIEHSLDAQYKNYKARNLKTFILRQIGRLEEALNFTKETQKFDIVDAVSELELYIIYEQMGNMEIAKSHKNNFKNLMRGDLKNYINVACDYMAFGEYPMAIKVLDDCIEIAEYPMLYYYKAYAENRINIDCSNTLKIASECGFEYCFPNTLEDLEVLSFAVKSNENDFVALYALGNLLYDKKRYNEAIHAWEVADKASGETVPTVKRNLALAYVNKKNDTKSALRLLEDAFRLDPQDSRVYYELDQLYKKLAYSFEFRINSMNNNMKVVSERDDLYLEYITLCNIVGENEKALKLIMNRKFHPWEGGEGKLPCQYVTANVEIAKKLLSENPKEAIKYLENAKVYPENIGEGKLEGACENNINYYLGLAYAKLGDSNKSDKYLNMAAVGQSEPTGAMYYNDQPPHMIFYRGMALKALNKTSDANSIFNKLIDYGEKNIFIDQTIDYFAVSLPDFLVFDDDINIRNKVHCNYMMGLGYLGKGDSENAKKYLEAAQLLDPNHQGVYLHLAML